MTDIIFGDALPELDYREEQERDVRADAEAVRYDRFTTADPHVTVEVDCPVCEQGTVEVSVWRPQMGERGDLFDGSGVRSIAGECRCLRSIHVDRDAVRAVLLDRARASWGLHRAAAAVGGSMRNVREGR